MDKLATAVVDAATPVDAPAETGSTSNVRSTSGAAPTETRPTLNTGSTSGTAPADNTVTQQTLEDE